MKSYEVDGRDYFFVSRQTMENFIQKKKFIEFGEYRGYLYGTSKDSIKRAMKSGKTCVLKVQPEVWKSFVMHSLHGYKCHHSLYCLVLLRGGVLPYVGYIGMSNPKGYGFLAISVINRVSILAILLPFWS